MIYGKIEEKDSISNLQSNVFKLIQIAQLDKVLSIHSNLDEAVAKIEK